MKIKFLRVAAIGTLLSIYTLVNAAYAEIITTGAMTYDDTTPDYVSDSLNHREWLRWDIVEDYTYNEIFHATDIGGEYEDWTMASSEDMNVLVQALYGDEYANSCTSTTINEVCGNFEFDIIKSMFGEREGSTGYDSVAFLSEGITEVGLLGVNTDENILRKYNDWVSIDGKDRWHGSGSSSISYQLYRETGATAVNEPATLAIFALGIIGLRMRRFKKQEFTRFTG